MNRKTGNALAKKVEKKKARVEEVNPLDEITSSVPSDGSQYILAIDPGPIESGLVVYGALPGLATTACVKPNEDVLQYICEKSWMFDLLAIEMIASYGMPVGREVFETCVWIGRFIEAFRGEHALVYRRDVKQHLCGSPKAKDANVWQALLDRFGPGKEKAVGTKAKPGPLYGVNSHARAALAVAVTYADQLALKARESSNERTQNLR